MDWIWQRLAYYVRPKVQVEFEGISEGELSAALRQEALMRLRHVEAIVFSDEIAENEKVATLKEWFLSGE